jgi:hypothetical protein
MKRWLARRRRESLDHGAAFHQHEDAGSSCAPGPVDAVCLVAIAAPSSSQGLPRQGLLGGKLLAVAAGGLLGRVSVPHLAAAPQRGTATLAQLPASAFDAIWAHLSDADRGAARLACRGLFDAAVRRAVLRPADLPAAADLPARFPALSELTLQLQHAGEVPSDLDLVHLHGWARATAGAMRHLRALEVEGRVRGSALGAVARLAAGAGPGLQALRLRGLRLEGAPRRASESGDGRRVSSSGDGRGGRSRRESSSGDGHSRGRGRRESSSSGRGPAEAGEGRGPARHARAAAADGAAVQRGAFSSSGSGSDGPSAEAREERFLCAMLEALPSLRELDLGCSSAPGGGWCASAAPLPPAALQRVGALSELRALAVDASAARDCRAAAAALQGLPLLQRLTLRASCSSGPRGGGGPSDGGPELAAALCGLTRLEQLELESHDLGADFGAALRLGRLQRLQSLALGLCPGLPPSVARQVRGPRPVQPAPYGGSSLHRPSAG